VAAEFSTVFNDSMLPRLVAKADTGRISNLAWGLGYLGGMVALIFVVTCMAASPQTGRTVLGLKPVFGLDPALGEDARATGPLAALWYFVFILPALALAQTGERHARARDEAFRVREPCVERRLIPHDVGALH